LKNKQAFSKRPIKPEILEILMSQVMEKLAGALHFELFSLSLHAESVQ